MVDMFCVTKRKALNGRAWYLLPDGKTWTNKYGDHIGRWKQETAALIMMKTVLTKRDIASGYALGLRGYA